MGGRCWRPWEVVVLSRLAGKRPWAEIATRLRRTVASVKAKAIDLSKQEKRTTAGLVPVTRESVVFLRPRTRADCEHGPRPCPWVGCRHHLLWEAAAREFDVVPKSLGKLDNRRLVRLLMRMEETCVIDLVQACGQHTLQQVGNLFGLTRERVRQIEFRGVRCLPGIAKRLGYKVNLDHLLLTSKGAAG